MFANIALYHLNNASHLYNTQEDAHFSVMPSHIITYTGLSGWKKNQSHLALQLLVKSVILPAVLYCKLTASGMASELEASCVQGTTLTLRLILFFFNGGRGKLE